MFKLMENCRTITAGPKRIIIEIDAEENDHLLKDIAHKFFITRLGQRGAEKKLDMVILLGIYLLC